MVLEKREGEKEGAPSHWKQLIVEFTLFVSLTNIHTPLHSQLSQLSGIPVERVEFAKAYGSFPCEISMLDIDSDLEWNPTLNTISSMPLSIYDDGAILYFK